MATALTLVNRVRRMLRAGDTAAFDDALSSVVLDRVNDAIATVHSLFDWECDRREGALITYAVTDVATVDVSGGITSTSITDNGAGLGTAIATGASALTNAVLLLMIPADASDSTSVVRVRYGAYDGISTPAVLDTGWPGTGGASVTVRLLACEYGIPSTVREILSIRHQTEGAYLHDASGEEWISAFSRRPHLTQSNRAVAYCARRYNYPTANSASAPTASRTVLIYPTPSTAYRLDYSYLYQHPALSAIADTYDGPPRAIEDLVTALALARCTQDSVGDADPASGLAMEQRVLERAGLLHRQLGLRRDQEEKERKPMAFVPQATS